MTFTIPGKPLTTPQLRTKYSTRQGHMHTPPEGQQQDKPPGKQDPTGQKDADLDGENNINIEDNLEFERDNLELNSGEQPEKSVSPICPNPEPEDIIVPSAQAIRSVPSDTPLQQSPSAERFHADVLGIHEPKPGSRAQSYWRHHEEDDDAFEGDDPDDDQNGDESNKF